MCELEYKNEDPSPVTTRIDLRNLWVIDTHTYCSIAVVESSAPAPRREAQFKMGTSNTRQVAPETRFGRSVNGSYGEPRPKRR